ncbi:MAG: 4Fe-4S dicluster domain-containing protein [Epsilonproteobacteria bacterium]|nr:hypothetical protein [Campylobacterota bacterium]NPA56866.1 4Fe-4S dicluster domain-containing protein [Campylobacterota bacterium]
MEYRVGEGPFSLERLRCLRGDHYHQGCQACHDICPTGAFSLERGKLEIDLDRCLLCSVCLGVCPTEAIELAFFDPNDYLDRVQKLPTIRLSCQGGEIGCLSAFDTPHFARALLHHERVECDLTRCGECPLNPEGRTERSIEERIGEAERFVAALGIEKRVERTSGERERRNLRHIVRALVDSTLSTHREEKRSQRVPRKIGRLRELIGEMASSLPRKEVGGEYSFLSEKRIGEECDNCRQCTLFCPTGALFEAKEGRAIWFRSGDCIACGICHQVCMPGAIRGEEEIDILHWASGGERELIEHTIITCRECRTPFPSRGDLLCSRCREFLHQFGDLMGLAADGQ